jgi:hypothetical protein
MTNANSTVEDEKVKNTIGGEPKFGAPTERKVNEGSLELKTKTWDFFFFLFFRRDALKEQF